MAFFKRTLVLLSIMIVAVLITVGSRPLLWVDLVNRFAGGAFEVQQISIKHLGIHKGHIERLRIRLPAYQIEITDLDWQWIDSLLSLQWPRLKTISIGQLAVEQRVTPEDKQTPLVLSDPRTHARWPSISGAALRIEQFTFNQAGTLLLRGSLETDPGLATGHTDVYVNGLAVQAEWRTDDPQLEVIWRVDAPLATSGSLSVVEKNTSLNWRLQATSADQNYQWRLDADGQADLFGDSAQMVSGEIDWSARPLIDSEAISLACHASASVQRAAMETRAQLSGCSLALDEDTLTLPIPIALELNTPQQSDTLFVDGALVSAERIKLGEWEIRDLTIETPRWQHNLATNAGFSGVAFRDLTLSLVHQAQNIALDISIPTLEVALEEGLLSVDLAGRFRTRTQHLTTDWMDITAQLTGTTTAWSSRAEIQYPLLGTLVQLDAQAINNALQTKAVIDTADWHWNEGLGPLLGKPAWLKPLSVERANLRIEANTSLTDVPFAATLSIEIDHVFGQYDGTGIANFSAAPTALSLPLGTDQRPVEISWSADAVNPGLPLHNVSGRLAYDQTGWTLKALNGQLLGGELTIDQLGRFSEPGPQGTVQLTQLDLAQLAELIGNDAVKLRGRVDVSIPLSWHNGRIGVDQGSLVGRAGHIEYQPVVDGGSGNPQLDAAQEILANLNMESVSAKIDYASDGVMRLSTRIEGRNPDYQNGRPVHLNLNIENNMNTLLKSLRTADQINRWVERRMQREYIDQKSPERRP